MKFAASLVLFWMFLGGSALAWAQDAVTLTTITGEQVDMNLESISDGVVRGGDTTINLEDLMMIQTSHKVVSTKSAISVMLSGGGELASSGVAFNGEQFVVKTGFGNANLSPDSIKAILMDASADLSRFNRALENRSVELDTIVARTSSGQGVVRGLIESIEGARVMLNHDGKSRPVSLSKIIGIVTADLKPSKPDGQTGTVKLTDGSSITGSIGGLQAGHLTVELSGNTQVRLPLQNITAVSLRSDRVVYLSDLEPVDVSQNSLATIEFQWQRDRSVQRNPIRLFSPETGKVTEYARGIGTHAASRIEFENADGFDLFSAVVGIDAETEGNGDCQVSVWADGIKLWEARISGNSAPQKVDVGIDGMKKVALVVRNGQHLDLGDHVDWADARFLKTKKQ